MDGGERDACFLVPPSFERKSVKERRRKGKERKRKERKKGKKRKKKGRGDDGFP